MSKLPLFTRKCDEDIEKLKVEIQRLRAENETLRSAFNDLASCHTNSEYNETLSKIRALTKSQSDKGE